MNHPQEVEAKLLGVARPIAPLWQALATLRELDGFVLAPLADQHISDRYFDSPEGVLRQADLALRLRDDNEGCTVAIKGKSSRNANVVTRLEFEQPCSSKAIGRVAALLREHDVQLPMESSAAVTGMGEALARMGLAPWQTRTTRRQRRAVRPRDGAGAIAELALDECRYRVGADWLQHYEVEIESLGDDARHIAQLSSRLHARFRNELRPWAHSKLATGAALAALAAERGMNALVDGRATVRAEIYGDIEQWLAHAPHP